MVKDFSIQQRGFGRFGGFRGRFRDGLFRGRSAFFFGGLGAYSSLYYPYYLSAGAYYPYAFGGGYYPYAYDAYSKVLSAYGGDCAGCVSTLGLPSALAVEAIRSRYIPGSIPPSTYGGFAAGCDGCAGGYGGYAGNGKGMGQAY